MKVSSQKEHRRKAEIREQNRRKAALAEIKKMQVMSEIEAEKKYEQEKIKKREEEKLAASKKEYDSCVKKYLKKWVFL